MNLSYGWMRAIGMICLMLTLPGCVNQLDQRPGMIMEEVPIHAANRLVGRGVS
ncbi:hypothetical protein [Paenibacillus sp. OK060]|uniref:hypothetical protein n=1 Tax=Paenibacillus sp. OK060 TaxID=1881034 RepID=UPI0015A00320|nr:hypothetical protein [Paenibacillus sp. OK060]